MITKKLTPNETRILEFLYSFKINNQPFLFSNAGIASKVLGLEPTKSNIGHVQKYLKSMTDKGVIECVYQNGNKNGNRIDVRIVPDFDTTKELLTKEMIVDTIEDDDLPFNGI